MSTVIGALRAELSMDSSEFQAGVNRAQQSTNNLQSGFNKLKRGAVDVGYAQARIGAGFGQMSKAAQAVLQGIERTRDAIGRLESFLTPAATASEKYGDSVRQLTDAFGRGAITYDRYVRVLGLAKAQYDGVTAAALRSAQAERDAQAARDQAQRTATLKGFEGLHGSLDPQIAAAQRYQAAVRQVNAAVAAGVIDQTRANAVLGLARRQYDQAALEARDFASANQGSVDAFGRHGQGVQNLAYQFQDLAVQIGSGTDASVALGQQLPQMLSGFGAWAAILGVVVAVGIPLTRWLLNTGEAAEEAEKATEAFGNSLNAFKGYASTASASVLELREEFGVYAREVKAEALEMVRFSAAALSQAATGAGSPIQEQLAAVSEAYEEYIAALEGYAQQAATFGRSAMQEAQLAQMETAFEEVAQAAGLTGDEFVAVQAAMRGLANSAGQDLETVLDRLVNLRDTLREAFEGQNVPEISAMVDDLSAQINTLRATLAEAGVEADELGHALATTAADATEKISEDMRTASERAGDFARRLMEASGHALNLGQSLKPWLEYQGSRALGQSQGQSGGISGSFVDRLIALESGGDPSAMPKNADGFLRSSAQGLGQFIEDTWLRLFRFHFPDAAASLGTDQAILALRTDREWSKTMIEVLAEENRQTLAQAGQAITDTNLYLAHFLGPGGALAVLRNPSAPVSQTLGADQIRANPEVLGRGQTGQDVINWAAEHMGMTEGEVQALTTAVEANADALKVSSQAAEQAQNSLDSLTASLDPAAKASIELANMQAKVDAAVQGGAISATKGAQMMAEFQAALDARTAEEQAEKLADVQGELDAIVGSLDPATQASLEFAEAQKAIYAAVEAGLITMPRAQQLLDDLTMQQIMNTDEMKDLVAAQKAAAEEVQGVWDGATESMADYVSDGIMGGFEDGIEGAIDILKNGIKQMIAIALRNRIFIPIQTGIQAGLSGGTGTGMLGGIGSAIGGAMGGLMGGAGSVIGGLMTGGLGGAAGAIGTALSGATTGLAGFATALGAVAVPVAALVAVFSLFRGKTERLDSGLRVTIDGMDALVETFEKTRTTRLFGLIRNTDTDYDPASADVATPIQKAYLEVYKSVRDMANGLGVGADAFRDFSYDFKLSLEGMTAEQRGAALAAEFEKIADALATTAGVTGGFIRVGETASQALERMTNSLAAANGAMAALGFDLYDVSLRGADAASAFVELFGSLDQFTSAMEFYHSNFYSLAERAQEAARQFGSGLQDLGIQARPQTEDQFRALVDRLMAAGRTEDAAGLIQLAPLFQQLLALREEAQENDRIDVVPFADRLEAARRAAGNVDENRFSTRFQYERAQANAAQRELAPRVTEGERQIVISLDAARQEQVRMLDAQKQLLIQVATNTRHTANVLQKQDAVGPRAART